MADFYTAYDTEKGRVILQIPTDATNDDMALLQDMLNLIKAILEKRRADTPQPDCDKCIWNVCNYNRVDWDADIPQTDSENPNNCEHITKDGVTCAKYPACDDCLDNPLNKVKGSERLVKGSEQTDCPWK